MSLNMAVLLLSMTVSMAVFVAAPVVHYAQQWPLYEALRTTAAIIFAVVGAWFAIAYPERLRLLSGQTNGGTRTASTRMLDLFAPVVHSTFILCVILLVGVTAPILKGLVTDAITVDVLRRLSFALLVFLTLWQVWTVVLTLVPADVLKSTMDEDLSIQRARNALRGHAAVMPPPSDDVKD
ncbi:MAG TPA: hypothetical protein VFN09_08500 [Rhodanobacteraceae bacterium]|nr:hypothetical protein [Rhodanobacteraceae bacterium]